MWTHMLVIYTHKNHSVVHIAEVCVLLGQIQIYTLILSLFERADKGRKWQPPEFYFLLISTYVTKKHTETQSFQMKG